MPLRAFIFVLFAAFSCTSLAATKALFTHTTVYHGQLNYLDYRSNKTVAIPMQLSFSQSADGQHLIIDKVFTDPGYKVYSLSVMHIDFSEGVIIETSFDSAGKSEARYEIIDFSYQTAGDWSITRRTLKQDDNQDAKVTITDSVSAGQFSSETHVDYLATQYNENLKRNWVVASTTATDTQ